MNVKCWQCGSVVDGAYTTDSWYYCRACECVWIDEPDIRCFPYSWEKDIPFDIEFAARVPCPALAR
jgi:hypothetical protein